MSSRRPIKSIIKNMRIKQRQCRIRAFTLLETLLALAVVSFLALAFYGTVGQSFHQTDEQLFLLEFEHFYKESQELAIHANQPVTLEIDAERMTNGYQERAVPSGVHPAKRYQVTFSAGTGGNSSLEKIIFQLGDRRVQYQLYIGSGRYQKTED